jgi:hypothetical protein
MKQFLITFFLTLISTTCSAQDSIKNYRQQAKNVLTNFFNPETISKIECEYFTVTKWGHDGLTKSYPCSFDHNIDVTDASYGFQYSLFSKDLNYKFIFSISLDTASSYHYDSSKLVSHIPECIRRSEHCSYVSLDSILKIIKGKSKSFTVDLIDVELEKNKKDGEFYWLLSNEGKTNIINALTGKFIKRSGFAYSW